MFKLFLGVLSVSTFCVYSADNTARRFPDHAIAKPVSVLVFVPSTAVFIRTAEKRETVEEVKAFYAKQCNVSMGKITVIQKGCNIPHDTSVQDDIVVKKITESYTSTLNGTVPPYELAPSPGVDLKKACPATLEVFKRGVNLSREKDAVLAKDTEYVVLVPVMYQINSDTN